MDHERSDRFLNIFPVFVTGVAFLYQTA